MTTYRVEVDGIVVWTGMTDEYGGLDVFPEQYLGRPASGVIELFVNDEPISRAVPESEE